MDARPRTEVRHETRIRLVTRLVLSSCKQWDPRTDVPQSRAFFMRWLLPF